MNLTWSKQKFESKIIDHFEENGKYDHFEGKKIRFYFTEKLRGNVYEFDFAYDPDWKKVYDEISCYCENNEVELILKLDNNNPTKESLYDVLQLIIEKQDKVNEENKKSSEAIQSHNEYMDLNNR